LPNVRTVLNRSNTGIVGSNPARGTDVVMLYDGRGPTMGRTTVQGVLPKCLSRFKVSEFNSESERAAGSNV